MILFKDTFKIAFLLFTFLICFVACEDDDDGDDTVGQKKSYVFASMNQTSTSGTASYALAFNLSDTLSRLSSSNAVEITSDNAPVVFKHNSSLFFNQYSKSLLSKWNVSDNGSLTKSAEINFTDLGYQCNLCFKNDEVAFTGGPGTFKIAIFNPTTMMRTGFIDLSPISQIGMVTNFPSQGDSIVTEVPAEMIISGNYMYVAIYYCNMMTWVPNTKTCEIVIVDLTKVDANSTDNSGAVVKRISDTRGSYTGGWSTGGGSAFMILDENQDLYLLCHNMWGNYGSVTGLPACVLRIKNGETEFDQSYYFNVEEVSTGFAVMGLEYAGNGIFFGLGQDPSKIDPTNPYSYFVDPIYRWFKFNLYDKTATMVDNTYTKASITLSYFENGKAYLPFSTGTQSYINVIDVETLVSSQKIYTDMDGIIFKMD